VPERAPAQSPDAGPVPSMIGMTLVMKGELIVDENLIIEGTFDGTITGQGSDTITVRRTAHVSGKISASKVRIEDGTNLENTVLSGRISLADS
jgi:cytoskeletal protein CcmA (bactofilin family)